MVALVPLFGLRRGDAGDALFLSLALEPPANEIKLQLDFRSPAAASAAPRKDSIFLLQPKLVVGLNHGAAAATR